jgi:S-adenosylmethionine synthetase
VVISSRGQEDAVPGLETSVPLSDLVEAVREELQEASLKGRGSALQFEIDKVEIAAQVEAVRAHEGGGGLKVWVVSLGGKASSENTSTHTVTLTMTAVRDDGTKFRVSDLSADTIRRE